MEVGALALELQQPLDPLPIHAGQPLPLGRGGAIHVQLNAQPGSTLHAGLIRQGQPWILVKF